MFEEKDILRFLSGDSDPELLKKIDSLKADKAFDQDLSEMSKVWAVSDELKEYQQFDTEAAWDTFAQMAQDESGHMPFIIDAGKPVSPQVESLESPEAKIIQAPRSSMVWKWVAAAASAAILVTAGYFLLQKDPFIYVGGETWAKTTLMPDGSKVTLEDRSSSFKYPRTFQDSTQRRIYLEGNATVDVKSDPSVPFYVQNYGTQVRALGTEFRIDSDSSLTELLNISGKMSLAEMADTSNKVVLEIPGEKAVFDGGKIEKIEIYVAPPPPDTPGVHMPIIEIIDFLTDNFESEITTGGYLKESDGTVKVLLLNQSLEDILAQLDSTANIQVAPASRNNPKIIKHFTPK